MKYALFPGCSAEHLASSYQDSITSIANIFRMEFSVIPDWNCCGATEYLSVNRTAAYALSARNLALVPSDCKQVVASCSACFLNLKKTDETLARNPEYNRDVNIALAEANISYTPGNLDIRHILEVFINDIGLELLKAKVTAPLSGLRVAPYYGCMLVRPRGGKDNPEYPQMMDKILAAMGAEIVDTSLKAYCCGGHMPHIKAATGYEILYRILKETSDKGADIIAVACPVCQLNLDAYQGDVNKSFGMNFNIPILFFTQLMGLALGIDQASLGIGKELVPAEKVLRGTKRAHPDNEKKNALKSGLPMPEMKRGN